jgi:hypothetical protein
MPSIQTITDQDLIDAIDASRQRIVFVAPGIWPEVAEALSCAWHRMGAERVSVILDIDAEVCRFGYGSIEGLQILKQTADELSQAIGHEPGIRIRIVIADDRTFIFSPTPRLIESSPGSTPVPGSTAPRSNGIVLSTPPDTVASELGVSPEQATERTIGMEAVDPGAIEAVAKDLKLNPPKTFDVARAVNVYNAAIQFAELEVTGCRLSGHKASARDFLRANRRSNIHLYPDDWKKLPIPDVSAAEQKPIVALVDQILTLKRANRTADISALETQLDTAVAAHYGLTPEEIAIVEGTAK